MIKDSDVYSQVFLKSLFFGNGTDPVGNVLLSYEVRRFDDVFANSRSDAQSSVEFSYIVTCIQSTSIVNESGRNLSPVQKLTSYSNYPALLSTINSVATSDGQPSLRLLSYSPKTVNTVVQASQVSGTTDGQSSNRSASSTVGSSTSQTNSYGVNVSAESISANYEHSSTTTSERSRTSGTENSTSKSSDQSASAAMSVKDWGAYALIDPLLQTASWVFGQEYPWDVVLCRATDGTVNPNNPNQTRILISDAMQSRLFDANALYPPSQLAMFGFTFISHASWLVTLSSSSVSIQVNHDINLFMASHQYTTTGDAKGGASAFIDNKPAILVDADKQPISVTLELPLMALDPVGTTSATAALGFAPQDFIIAPVQQSATTQAQPFAAVASANNLYVTDETSYGTGKASQPAGFIQTPSGLQGQLSALTDTLTIGLYFKIKDTSTDHTLFIKGWKGSSCDIVLSISINNNPSSVITKYISDAEFGGADRNVVSISLRNLDFSSNDYHDFLKLGTNVALISVSAVDKAPSSPAIFNLRAVSVE